MAAYSTHANYQDHTNAVNAILLDMKTQLDKYRESPTANPTAVAIRERNLVTLVKYVEASANIIQSLANARDEAYRAGIERGRELAAAEGQHSISPRWPKNNFRSAAEKESYRWEQNTRSNLRWADHY